MPTHIPQWRDVRISLCVNSLSHDIKTKNRLILSVILRKNTFHQYQNTGIIATGVDILKARFGARPSSMRK